MLKEKTLNLENKIFENLQINILQNQKDNSSKEILQTINVNYFEILKNAIDTKNYKKIHDCISLLKIIEDISPLERFHLHEIVNIFELQNGLMEGKEIQFGLSNSTCFNAIVKNRENNLKVGFTFDTILQDFDLDFDNVNWIEGNISPFTEGEWSGVILGNYHIINGSYYFVRKSHSDNTNYILEIININGKYYSQYTKGYVENGENNSYGYPKHGIINLDYEKDDNEPLFQSFAQGKSIDSLLETISQYKVDNLTKLIILLSC